MLLPRVYLSQVSKTESWLQTETNKQNKLPKHENPVLTAEAVGKVRPVWPCLALSGPCLAPV